MKRSRLGFNPLNLACDILDSKFAFSNFNLYRYAGVGVRDSSGAAATSPPGLDLRVGPLEVELRRSRGPHDEPPVDWRSVGLALVTTLFAVKSASGDSLHVTNLTPWSDRVGPFHVILQSKHQLITASM